MECPACSESLGALIDGELDPQEERQMEMHLSQCAPCQAEYQSLLFATGLLEQTAALELPAHLWSGIGAAIAGKPQPAAQRARLAGFLDQRWIPIAATLVLGIGISIFFVSEQNTQRTRRQLHHYVEQREQVEVEHMLNTANNGISSPAHPNPFAVAHRTFDRNPFRAE